MQCYNTSGNMYMLFSSKRQGGTLSDSDCMTLRGLQVPFNKDLATLGRIARTSVLGSGIGKCPQVH